MANPTLNWTINRDRGTINFGRLLPLTGNTYTLNVTGGATGESYTFYVMDESGEICLAKSANGAIEFKCEALRNQFAKDWHECKTFHCVCSNGTATVAESDLTITWNPVWTEIDTGSAYSMRGPQGIGISAVEFVTTDANGNFVYQFRLTNGGVAQWTAPRGAQGPASNIGCVYDTDGDHKWHKLIIRTNRFGEKTIDVDPNGTDEIPELHNAVTTDTAQTITGTKTFTQPALVPTIASTDDNSTKAASTGWVTSKLASWWTAIKAAAHTIGGAWTFTQDIIGHATADAKVDLSNITSLSDSFKNEICWLPFPRGTQEIVYCAISDDHKVIFDSTTGSTHAPHPGWVKVSAGVDGSVANSYGYVSANSTLGMTTLGRDNESISAYAPVNVGGECIAWQVGNLLPEHNKVMYFPMSYPLTTNS